MNCAVRLKARPAGRFLTYPALVEFLRPIIADCLGRLILAVTYSPQPCEGSAFFDSNGGTDWDWAARVVHSNIDDFGDGDADGVVR